MWAWVGHCRRLNTLESPAPPAGPGDVGINDILVPKRRAKAPSILLPASPVLPFKLAPVEILQPLAMGFLGLGRAVRGRE